MSHFPAGVRGTGSQPLGVGFFLASFVILLENAHLVAFEAYGGFLTWGVPQNGWFIEKILLKWMIWGIRILGNHHRSYVSSICCLHLLLFAETHSLLSVRCFLNVIYPCGSSKASTGNHWFLTPYFGVSWHVFSLHFRAPRLTGPDYAHLLHTYFHYSPMSYFAIPHGSLSAKP